MVLKELLQGGGKMSEPTHGFTKHGHAVHQNTMDHMNKNTPYKRFNNKFAVFITSRVGTMTCAYVFSIIAFISLPAILVQAGILSQSQVPGILTRPGLILIVAWIAQTFIQLVLLSVIMVGQDVQSKASDVRAAKTFEDTEKILDAMDIETEGGIKDLADLIKGLKND